MKYNFDPETYNLFALDYECWFCGKKHANCLHHILGRVSNSPLNAAPLNNHECHIGNGKLETEEYRTFLLQKTMRFLLKNGYQFTEKDQYFILKYKKYYD